MGGNLSFNDNDDVQLKGATDATLIGNSGNSLNVNVTASALPSGAATSSLQTTANTSLSSIDTKTPALGQALAAASTPVVLTAAQLATLTPLTTVAVTQSGTWNITNISGTVSLPTGASTSSLQTTANTSLSSIDTKTPALGQALAAASVPVVLTAAQLTTLTPLTSVTVTQATGTNLHTVVDSSALPTGAATSALQTAGNTSLSSIDGKLNSLGQKTMANSVPVVISSDQSPVSVTPTAYSYFHPVYTTRVQSATGSTGSATTSLVIPITASRAGSLIAVAVSSSVIGTVTVTDNLAQSYSTAISGTTSTHTNYIFYKANSSSGVTSLTITSTVSSGLAAVVTEYFGVSSSPLDKTASATVTSASFSSGATATTTSAIELLLGSAHGTTKNNSTYTAGTNWTTVGLSNGFNAGAGQLYLEEQYVLATGAQTATGTASASDTIISDIATFVVNGASNITTLNTAKIIKSGAGTLASFIINTPGTGGATATLYDGLSATGTVIAVISLVNAGTVNVALHYNLSFTTGLTIVLNSTTADVTVVYA